MRNLSGLPSCLRIAAAPTLPPCTELSEYTLISSTAFVSALLDLSLLKGISMCVACELLLLG